MAKRIHKRRPITSDAPTYDFLEKRNLDSQGDLHWIVEDFIDTLERALLQKI